MTLSQTVGQLLALRPQVPAEEGDAHELLDSLAAASTEEEQRRLVRNLLVALATIPSLSAAVASIARRFADAETPGPDDSWPEGASEGGAASGESSWPEAVRREPASLRRRWMRGWGTRRRERRRVTGPGVWLGAPEKRVTTFERTPHLDVEPSSPVPVGSRLEVSVYVDTQALREGESGDVLVLPTLKEVRLCVTLTTSPHFTVRGKRQGEIVVSPDRDRSTTSSFELDCVGHAEGRAGIAASFTYGWRPAGSVWRELEIEGAAPLPAQRVTETHADAVEVDMEAGPPDLQVTILPSPDGDERHFDLTVSSRHLTEYTDGVTVPWHLPERTKDYVAGFMAAFTTSDPGGRKAALIGAGKDLFAATPEEFRRAFWELVDHGKPLRSIFVVTSEPFIPWELMVPNEGPKVRPPLGVEFSVGRWVHPKLVSPPQAMRIVDSAVIAPNYRADKKLAFSADEAKFVVDAFNGKQISPAWILDIDAALTAHGPTLLHLVCHGLDDSNGQILDLDPDQTLREIQLDGLDGVVKAVREARPFVFINACQVGRPTLSLVGTGGFAARFTRMGARCVIAPIWSVKDSVAGTVARSFYERVKAEPTVPFAEILRDIRKLAYEGDDPEDSYAAYCFYGDPLAAQETAKPAAPA